MGSFIVCGVGESGIKAIREAEPDAYLESWGQLRARLKGKWLEVAGKALDQGGWCVRIPSDAGVTDSDLDADSAVFVYVEVE